MTPSTGPAVRVLPLDRAGRDAATEEALARLRGPDGGDLNLFATLAHHPRLLTRCTALGGTLLLRGQLPARARELLILRTAHNTGAAYEWAHHAPLARRAGLTDEEVDGLRRPVGEGGWAPADEALVTAVDELHHGSGISDGTWAQLTAVLDVAQLVELCVLVGYYHLIAFTVNSLGIQPEPGLDAPPPGG